MTPIYFQVTWSKVKVKLLVFEKMLFSQYLLTPLLESCQTLYSKCIFILSVVYSLYLMIELLDGYQIDFLHWLTLERRLSLLLFG